MARLAMLIDLTRCIGCDACTVACKQENGTPADVFFARVLNVEAGTYPHVKRIYIPVLCNHCDNPACLKACPNKAIFRREDGIVLIDQERCRGTGACVSACPYGNIILTDRDRWYLPEDMAYERDYVRPRLKPQVARKCTFCAQRVDQGLDPACVVACPTTARIFGDLEDPESKISTYIAEQKELTGREPFHLLPEAKTEPANVYLGTMASQQVSTFGGSAEPTVVQVEEPTSICPAEDATEEAGALAGAARRVGQALSVLFIAGLLFVTAPALAAPPSASNPPDNLRLRSQQAILDSAPNHDLWSASSCAGCHGPTAMGGFGPPLAETKRPEHEFMRIVRTGKGMMPATSQKELSDKEVAAIYRFVRQTKLDPSQIPLSYKVASLFTTRNVGIGFSIISLVALLLAVKVLLYWVDCAGWRWLKPYIRKFGYLRAIGVILWSILVDGFLVASLWRKDKFRWAMHALLLYGFVGLGLADILMSVFNPGRGGLPITHPLKLLPNLSGLAILVGIIYVRYRYSTDPYIDNGLTLGRDYLFLNLLALTILSGFLVEGLGYAGAIQWVLPTYILHLAVVATLFLSAPFTRFAHAFVVPVLVAITRLVETITASGVDLNFGYEPSPGRHHKSVRIAEGVLKVIEPEFSGKVHLRYFP
jgi:molybdopterin-containing oxidoreductase family iron-sulfur binding subunit